MKIIKTDEMQPEDLSPWEREQVYNGLDCCVTSELLPILLPQLDEHTSATYQHSLDLQGPVMEMRLRGILVDQGRKGFVLDQCGELLERLEHQLLRIVNEGVGLWEFNWRSNKDLQFLFYRTLQIPAITKDRRPTVDVNALEKLQSYFAASPIARHLLTMRELEKKIQSLRTETDNDGRIRTSLNIAGTDTGRFSSSFSEYGTGGNLQNIEESLRSIFISDPGYKLAYLDAEQGESRVVGAIEGDLFDDWRYLDACESGDLHTYVTRLVWPDLPWTHDFKKDRRLAEQPFYRHYDRRFMSKKIGHGSNYGGRPVTLATQAKVEPAIVEEFQRSYFTAFPAKRQWHRWTQRELERTGYIINLCGRKRWFWGRRDDAETLRKALAYQGQALADILNRGMLSVWCARDALLLNQIHDAILVQYPEDREEEIVPKILKQLEYPIRLNGREIIIPYSAATGWNWGKHSMENPDGIKPWQGEDKRKRGKTMSILDRKLSQRY
jgi:DNA polymerase I-like protein with 3'-5' exonuclease and polymerase domains